MKLTDLAILFVMIITPFLLMTRIQADNLQNVSYQNIVLNRYLDTAVEDAAEAMILRGMNQKLTISKEKALETFFSTLFTNFNVIHNERSKNTLMAYIPVVVLIDYDGYSIYSMEEYANMLGEKEQRMIWKPKKPYSYESGSFIYLFTLEQKVSVYDASSNLFYEGIPHDLKATVSDPVIQDDMLFEQVRKRTIIEAIKQDVNHSVNNHNQYAVHYGITYHFSPPSISEGDWHRNIEDIGFLAFFQGIPVGLNGERFNSYALGASRIVRKNHYFIQQNANGLLYYHREFCIDHTQPNEIQDTRIDCALKGAFPCPVCQP